MGCDSRNNTHVWCFGVDVIFSIIALAIGLDFIPIPNHGFTTAASTAGFILIHGGLHFSIGALVHPLCVLRGRGILVVAYYSFIFMLFFYGFKKIASFGDTNTLCFIFSGIITFLTYK